MGVSGLERATHLGDVGEPVRIEGMRGSWRLDPGATAADFTGRVALLSPLDRLIADRRRMVDLWDFAYALEQYILTDDRALDLEQHAPHQFGDGVNLLGRKGDPGLEARARR